MPEFPREADLELLGLEVPLSGNPCSFVQTPSLSRHDGALYGGAAISASVAAMEAATQRPALWVTTQFVAAAQIGERVEVDVTVLAQGKRIAQVQVLGHVGERFVFTSLGSTAMPRDGGLEGQVESMPTVGPLPKASGDARGQVGTCAILEFRDETLLDGVDASAVGMWARLASPMAMTPAGIAFAADMVPIAIARGLGRQGAGTSLDNSLRFGPVTDSEWVLLVLQGHMATGGYGHGSVHVWSPDGVLVAVGGQTANMSFLFDEAGPPHVGPPHNPRP